MRTYLEVTAKQTLQAPDGPHTLERNCHCTPGVRDPKSHRQTQGAPGWAECRAGAWEWGPGSGKSGEDARSRPAPWGSGRAWLGGPVWTEPGWHDLSPVQWDLVCDSRRMKEVAQSVFMAGTLIGGIVLGDLSDR